jgi:hypothetical protein
MTFTTQDTEESRRALTLAVVCVEQRVDALRAEWRGMSERERSRMPGLEEQIAAERAALRWLERRRSAAYSS